MYDLLSIEVLTLLFFGLLFLFIMLGVPLSFVLGGLSIIFLYFEQGPIAFYLIASKMWDLMETSSLIAIPLYVFMAMLLERSGVAHDLYRMMHLWWGGVRGGLAIGTVGICTIFAAMSGISGAAVVTMGTIALPQMLNRGYDKRLALGAINAGGGWGILIPPSILMVLYALITEVSVGKLFAAGVFPGLLLFALVSIYIGVRCWFQPHLGPSLPKEERADWGEKIAALRSVFLPIFIIFIVLGAIFGGFATVTEAAAVGVFGALVASVINRKLTWRVISESSLRTFRLTTIITWIVFAAHAYSMAYTAMGAEEFITHLTAQIPGGKWGALAFMMFVLFLLGMVLDPVGIMLITLPVFLPLVASHGFDPVWFGILFVIMMEISYMTPPFGFNLFYLRSVAPPDVTMKDIYWSVGPYTLVELSGLLIIVFFPVIALWLPNYLFQ
ncbi:TRAP transporter large permease subunit [Sneathiella chungangensis]|uniref:TRAP transporter large permease protein n=1 Tax=Sneathiella chungangensis TaxID=1418234 RepID=A0A845MDM0_9PROT|nr:TRAP transporter large permease subunit [Sneathiella chungangensis]MZR21742.1 TRAP transporter large permease subunit [Sneathiella chungangensis]